MTSNSMKEILNHCLELDILASKLYTKIANKSETEESKSFWKEMASEERDHVFFWKNAIKFGNVNTIPDIFEDCNEVINELKASKVKAERLFETIEYNNNIANNFLTSYWMEFYLLYPSFNTLFHYMGIMSEGKNSEDEYEKHLIKFVEGFEKFGNVSPEMELLGSILNSLWKRNHDLVNMTMYDPLTGIFNRRGINDLMISFISLAQRNKYQTGLLMIDIDNFKKINDTYGHQTGDAVLKEIAKKLLIAIRKSDLLGRFGGEEFIIFLSNIDKTAIIKLADKLNHAISDSPINQLNITVSIGCCIYEVIDRDANINIEKMISIADENLYKAKANGKNRYEI